MDTAMDTGTIRWSSPDAGFCIVAPDRGGDNIIVGVGDLRGHDARRPCVGARVAYLTDAAAPRQPEPGLAN